MHARAPRLPHALACAPLASCADTILSDPKRQIYDMKWRGGHQAGGAGGGGGGMGGIGLREIFKQFFGGEGGAENIFSRLQRRAGWLQLWRRR